MVSPIRIAGHRGDTRGLPDFSQMPEAGSQITYTAPNGERFGLHYPTVAESRVQRVVMKPGGMDGATARPEFTDTESATRFGVRQGDFKLPAIEVTTEVTITSDVKPVAAQETEWRLAWSHFKDGEIKVVNRGGANRWARARLVSMPDLIEELKGRRYFETSVTWRNLAGCWMGNTRRYFDTVTVLAPGDLPPSLRLRWDGRATSVGFPDGRTVNLPAISGTRFINLDYGMSGQVTFEHGLVDSVAWSQLRGLVSGLTLMPHESASFVLGAGLSLEVTPRYLSPWG